MSVFPSSDEILVAYHCICGIFIYHQNATAYTYIYNWVWVAFIYMPWYNDLWYLWCSEIILFKASSFNRQHAYCVLNFWDFAFYAPKKNPVPFHKPNIQSYMSSLPLPSKDSSSSWFKWAFCHFLIIILFLLLNWKTNEKEPSIFKLLTGHVTIKYRRLFWLKWGRRTAKLGRLDSPKGRGVDNRPFLSLKLC